MDSIAETYAAMGIYLTRVGSYWKSPCPFHSEDDPSFTVYPDGGYHCFGCQKHGTMAQLYEEVLGENLCLISPWSLEDVSYKREVDFSNFISITESRLRREATGLKKLSKIYKRALLAEMYSSAHGSEGDVIHVMKVLRKLLVV